MTLLGLILAVGILGYFFLQSGAVNSVTAVFMGKLTAKQIADFAANAGFTNDDVVTMTAIVLAESGGDPNATGDKTTGAKSYGGVNLPLGTPTSYGLAQIHFTVHPEVLNGADPSILFDPQTNLNAAYTVFQEQGFNAWSTYGDLPGHNNAYANYLDEAGGAVSA